MAPTTYADVLSRNIRATRARRGLSQGSLAERMRALGHEGWVRQTVGSTEKPSRRVTADEVLGLSLALETTISALMAPADDDEAIGFPDGSLPVVAVRLSTIGKTIHGAVQWDGDRPVFGPADYPPDIADVAARMRAGAWPPVSAISSSTPAKENELQPVVAAIVTSELGVLVGRRNDGKPPWTFIAGEQDAVQDENPADTAVREVKEETGLQIETGEILGQRVHPKTGRTMIYMAATPTRGTDIFVGDEDELAEVRWISLAEADELLPGMFEPVHDYLAARLGKG